jgi:hypothetical protein
VSLWSDQGTTSPPGEELTVTRSGLRACPRDEDEREDHELNEPRDYAVMAPGTYTSVDRSRDTPATDPAGTSAVPKRDSV